MTRIGTWSRFGLWAAALVGLAVMVSPIRAEGWKAGVAQVDITPDQPVWMAGYAARKAPSEGVILPIHAKALALNDGQGRTIVWITADLIGFRRELSERIAAKLKEHYGLERSQVALFASHTHTGPLVNPGIDRLNAYGIDPDAPTSRNNTDYVRTLETKVVAVVGQALDRLQPVTASFGVGHAGFATNRREKTDSGYKLGVNPDGPTDRSVPVLRVSNMEGKSLAIVFGYACHNTTLGGEILDLSGDYAGFAQEQIEADNPGAVALFVTGCAGDANPQPRGTIDLARQHGRSLAAAVSAVLDGTMQDLSGTIRTAMAEPAVHFAGPTDRASYEKRLDEPNSSRQAHARRMLARLDANEPIETEHPYPIQAFALGDGLTMVALAGEVVVDYAKRLQHELGGEGRALWVAAYANDVFGYIPSVRVLHEGGYEGGDAYYYSAFPGPLAEDIESIVAGTAADLVRKVRSQ